MGILAWSAAVFLGWSQAQAAAEVRAADLAIILPAGGNDKIAASEPYFSPRWLAQIDAVFRSTSIEDAFLTESAPATWRLVSMRIAPCQPLLPYLTPLNQTLCEVEVRLVWQPIEQIRRGGIWTHYADDRAIHALYHADARAYLAPEDAVAYEDLKSRSASLEPSEIATYRGLHRGLVQGLMADLVRLRSTRDPLAWTTLAERPEFQSSATAKPFISRLKSFLKKAARFDRLKELTAFSLPAGRQPPLLDDWVFVAFHPADSGRSLASKNITLTSRQDGRTLFAYGPSMSGTMRFDDPRLHGVLEHMPPDDAEEVRAAVILAPRAPTNLKDALADRLTTHVSHTSCVSCHKLKDQPFDLHNLSYLEDQALVPSPRVEQDVAHDLDWLRSLEDPATNHRLTRPHDASAQ